MTTIPINVGSAPDDHTGDVLRDAMIIINTNFDRVVKPDVTANLTAGYTATAEALGTVSSGTTTLSATSRDYHTLTNNGAFTLAPPSPSAPADCCSGVVEITNGASAGAITTSGWTKVNGSFTTTNADKFQCDYCVTPNGSYLNVRALQ